ncbi:MAG: hypothetical protein JOS17DRAFT_769372, partial [Linnemannia elongata]
MTEGKKSGLRPFFSFLFFFRASSSQGKCRHVMPNRCYLMLTVSCSLSFVVFVRVLLLHTASQSVIGYTRTLMDSREGIMTMTPMMPVPCLSSPRAHHCRFFQLTFSRGV